VAPMIMGAELLAGGHTVVVTLAGELAYETANQVRPRLSRIAAHGCRRLVLDAARLVFLDSTGLSVLVAARLGMVRRGGRMEIRALSGQPARFLATTGTAALFHADS
jgi:anti-anti-sigma factor